MGGPPVDNVAISTEGLALGASITTAVIVNNTNAFISGLATVTVTGPGSQALGSTLTAWYIEPDGARRDETDAQPLGGHRYRVWLAPGTWTFIADTGGNSHPRRRIVRSEGRRDGLQCAGFFPDRQAPPAK